MSKKIFITNYLYRFIYKGLIIIIIFLLSFYSYSLFHSLAEIFSIVISFGVYMVMWNSRSLIKNNYFVFLGIAFFYIAIFDLLHILTFLGLEFTSGDASFFLSVSFWLAARCIQAFSFLVAIFFINKNLKMIKVFYFYTIVSVLFLCLILARQLFLVVDIKNHFFAYWQYIFEIGVCLFSLITIFIFYKKKKAFHRGVFNLLLWALIFSISSEAVLIINDSQNHVNVLTHILKIVSFYLIYVAFIETGLRKPYALLFKELKDSEVKHRRIEQKFITIFNNANVGILMTDLNAYVLEANQNFLMNCGYKLEDIKSDSLFSQNKLCHGIDKNKEIDLLRSGHLNSYIFEYCYLKNNGEYFWGDTSISVIKDENSAVKYLLWVIHDITSVKEIEKTKIEFISLTSHQLRTHLTGICLASELLLRGVNSNLDSRQLMYLNEINNSSKRMSEMIRDFLNVSRAELGTLLIKPEIINLKNICGRILDELSAQIKNGNIIITQNYDKDIPSPLLDLESFRMIFENLLSNAIRYTPAGGRIDIKAVLDIDRVIISISDNGYGIPEDEQDKIFDKSFRASNVIRIYPNGNGLGLYLVRMVADKNGVDVYFNSTENVGTTFFIAIPLSKKISTSEQGKLFN